MHSQSPPEGDLEELTAQVYEFFYDREEVACVYLFGSQTSGRTGPDSDVDVGLLFRADFDPGFKYLGSLRTDLEHELKRRADLVDLGKASPILRMQVLRKGVLVLDRDGKTAGSFFARTINEYFDLKRVRRPIELRMTREEIDG